jgi:UDP-N-acetylmuramoylalanine--D-glutamate ligase
VTGIYVLREVRAVESWKDRKVVIIGAARQGAALARYLVRHGSQVVLNDRRAVDELDSVREALADLQLEWVCGGHPLELLEGTDLVCVSGGVPLSLPLVNAAQQRGIPLSNDSQVFMQVVPCKVIGITGSAGKTTTTTLVGRMAQAATEDPQSPYYGRRAWVGGNIGSPLISVVDEMCEHDLAVMELSSFQLEIMSLSPQVAAVLNITPNHLDRHGTMEAYTAAKARILTFQSEEDEAVLGHDDPGAWALAEHVQGRLSSFGLAPIQSDGVFLQDEAIHLHSAAQEIVDVRVIGKEEISLRGEHNLLNVMAACAIASAAGLPVQSMRKGILSFTGVPHRLEFVRSWGGADWYNDSIATAPERAIAAIRSFDEPLVLLAGGRDKDLPWDDFADLVRSRVDHLVVFGEATDVVIQALDQSGVEGKGLSVTQCENLAGAVQAAAEVVQPGDVVLLSPGGTSFDEFNDFEERGECFAQWVKGLE